MKVFISWSGEISKKAAEAFKDWLEQCIQSLEVFFSADDIEKGSNWQAKLTNELKDTHYGIICLTSENAMAPWVHFEAGALSKMLDSKVMVVTINIKISEIVGPLTSFQATKIEEADIYKLLQSINNSQDKPLSENKLKNSFDAFWPSLKNRLDSIIKSAPPVSKNDKVTKSSHIEEVLDEILQLVRNQNALNISSEKNILTDSFELNYKKAGVSSHDMLYEIYDFTERFLITGLLRLEDRGVQDFIVQYRNLFRRLCMACDELHLWQRFELLFRDYVPGEVIRRNRNIPPVIK